MYNCMEKRRNSSIETLRLFFMYCIVIYHTFIHGSHFNFKWIYSLGADFSTSWYLAIYSLSTLGVSGFMFISGYYGVKMSYKKLFYIIFTSFFYALILTLALSVVNEKDIFYIIFAFENYWYVSAYLIIMILSPILNRGIQMLSKMNFLLIVLCLFSYTYIVGFINVHNSRNITFLLTIYMIARYVKLNPNSYFVKMLQKWGGIFLILLLLLPICMSQLGLDWRWGMLLILQNNNPLLLFISIWLFLMCEKRKTYFSKVNIIASGTLAIYLITDLPIVREKFCPIFLTFLSNGWGLLLIVGVCLLCALIDCIPRKIFEYIDLYAVRLLLKSNSIRTFLNSNFEFTKN